VSVEPAILTGRPYPPATRGTIVVWGILARMPFGGVTWQALQHLVGFRRLGFDVWYVEDSHSQLYHPTTHCPTMEYEDNLAYLARWMERIGLPDRWIFRPPGSEDRVVGADSDFLAQLYRRADAVVNVCAAQEIRDEHAHIRRLVYLETDPVQVQVNVAHGDEPTIATLEAHHHHFTYGENLGHDDCLVPVGRHRWLPTRPPVVRDWWDTAGMAHREVFTTVANWAHSGKDVEWAGHAWHWSKDREFARCAALPRRVRWPLEIALGGAPGEAVDMLVGEGWRVVPSIADPDEYRDYILRSGGEFTAAKEQYVAPRSGWFSDRSATYLAAGRPVVTQDTGFGKFVPTGEGLFAFASVDEAAAAIDAIATDYDRHSAAAREIAREYFDAERVLGRILQAVGLL
jgi:hypothetical protein